MNLKEEARALGRVFKENFAYLLAACLIIGTVYVTVLIFKSPYEFRDLIMISVGTLYAKLSTVVDYYWGTSKSSKDKDKLITSKN